MTVLSLLACEPVPVIWAALAGPGLTLSWAWKGLAALACVVIIKSLVFAGYARMGWIRGFAMMILGNVVSTIPGLVIGVLMGAGPLSALLVGLALLYGTSLLAGRAFDKGFRKTSWSWLTASRFASLSTLFGLGSGILLILITKGTLANLPPLLFLSLKALAFFFLMLCSIGITIGFEAGAVLFLAGHRTVKPQHVLSAAVRANLVVFFAAFLLAALAALPIRMRRSDFLWPYPL